MSAADRPGSDGDAVVAFRLWPPVAVGGPLLLASSSPVDRGTPS